MSEPEPPGSLSVAPQRHIAAKTVAAFLLFTVLWVVGTDRLAETYRDESGVMAYLQSVKGVVYALIASGLLYQVLKSFERNIDGAFALHDNLFAQNIFPMLLLDPASARIVRANRQAAEFYGYRAAELAGMPVSAIALAVDGRVAERIGQAMRGEANSFRTRHRLKGGDVRDVTVYASPLAASAGPLLFCFVADDTAKRLREEELHAALAQKDVLLKEIHHRVKNNLQIVANLLFLQEASLADPAARVLLQESQDRIRSMALIHEELYTSPDLSSVDMHNFLATLAGKVAASMEPPVQLRLDLAAVQLPITLSVPCGLIVNELLMNCVKHAFAGRPGGTLDLGLGEAGGLVTITVGDDGPGLPVGFAPADPKTLGLTLVNALVGQLRGRLEAETRHGALFTLTFPGGRDDV